MSARAPALQRKHGIGRHELHDRQQREYERGEHAYGKCRRDSAPIDAYAAGAEAWRLERLDRTQHAVGDGQARYRCEAPRATALRRTTARRAWTALRRATRGPRSRQAEPSRARTSNSRGSHSRSAESWPSPRKKSRAAPARNRAPRSARAPRTRATGAPHETHRGRTGPVRAQWRAACRRRRRERDTSRSTPSCACSIVTPGFRRPKTYA